MGIPIFKEGNSTSTNNNTNSAPPSNSGPTPTQLESTAHGHSDSHGQNQNQPPFRALPREEAERMFMEAMEEQYARQEGGA